jgi:hypothetical protein
MEMFGGREGTAPTLSYTQYEMGLSSQYHALATFYPWEKYPQYPLDRRLGGPQSQSGHRNLGKNPLPIQSIDRQYTDLATLAQFEYVLMEIMKRNGSLNCIIINLQFLQASSYRLTYLKDTIS